MPVARLADLSPVARRRRHDGRAAHRLRDDRADVALPIHHVLQVGGAGERARGPAAEGTAGGIGRRHVLGSRQKGADVAPEEPLSADADRVERRPVEGVPHREGLEAARRDARELQRDADRLRAARREQDLAVRDGGEGGKPLREAHRGLVRVAPGAERQGVEPVLHRLDDARMAVAHLVDRVAVEIEVPAPLDVDDPASLGAGERVEAGGRERLPKVGVGVAFEEAPRRRTERRLLPASAPGREVDVALHASRLVEAQSASPAVPPGLSPARAG